MTTAPVPTRIPTPGDLALRQPPKPTNRPATPATPDPAVAATNAALDALIPGKLTREEHFRKTYLLGLRASRMPAHARLVGHDLMWRASHATGRISPTLQPTTEVIALATGLTVGQVDVALQILHSRGWLHYRRLQEGPRAGRNAMALTIPALALEDIRAQRAKSPRTKHS
ncbi:hypothetical protein GTY23_23155 [Streptomyces sp. SID5998]|nr:hypothetical protein [Streptomyces sp. SID5998]